MPAGTASRPTRGLPRRLRAHARRRHRVAGHPRLARRAAGRAWADSSWLSDTARVHVATAPLIGVIAVSDLYDVPATIAAGRLWQRLHLIATAEGFSAQPLNQPVERVDREARRGDPPATRRRRPSWTSAVRPTFPFRIDTAMREAAHSPRRDVAEVLVETGRARPRCSARPVARGYHARVRKCRQCRSLRRLRLDRAGRRLRLPPR